MHLVIYFCGTSNAGDDFPEQYDYAPTDGSVHKIFVKGCDQPEVCNSALFPDLKSFAHRFTNKLFNKNNRIATTDDAVLESIGIQLDRTDYLKDSITEDIESITLCGYSRGAVTCFEVAEELDKLAPTIPIDIVADQPVPGNLYSGPGSNVASIADCSHLSNLNNVSIILGAYTGAKISGVDLYVTLAMPKNLTKYKHSYLLVNSKLYYINSDNEAQEIEFNDEYDTQKVFKLYRIYPTLGCNLYLMAELPNSESLTQYRNSYIFIAKDDTEELYYVNSDDLPEPEPVKINDFTLFKKNITDLNPEDQAHLHLKNNQVKEIITLNGGHTPTIKTKHSLSHTRINFLTKHSAPELHQENTDLSHRAFFSQVVPKLPINVHRDLIIIPRESHHQNRLNAPSGSEHMHMQVAKYLHKKKLISPDMVQKKIEDAQATYSQHKHIPPYPFPPISELQSFFGLKKEKAYRYVDKLHPTAHLRKNMIWNGNESLIDWWNVQDKKSSYFSSQLTKDLVKAIAVTSNNDVDQLKKLFSLTEHWLIAKQGTSTSRYYQIESLRNNIFYHLINTLHVPKEDLLKLNRQILSETDYFLNHWLQESDKASLGKSDETRMLDDAFNVHSKSQLPPEEKDLLLMNSLDNWLKAKKGTQSKRFDLVIGMREQLQEILDNYHSKTNEMNMVF